MNVTIQNQSLPNTLPNPVGLYDNGHFSSAINSSAAPLTYNSFQPLSETETLVIEVGFSDFDYKFKFNITDIEWNSNSDKIFLYLNLDDTLSIKLSLEGCWTSDEEPEFQHKSSIWSLHKKLETPVSNFLLSTLWAMLNLSDNVEIVLPELNYYFTSSFQLPLNEISKFLQERQIAYRLLIIEQTFKTHIPFPDGFIDGKDVENIAFCYHAIVDREFDWSCNELTFFPIATEEYLNLLPPTNKIFPLNFPTDNEIRVIFGQTLNLRQFMIEINQAVVKNYKEAQEKLNNLDGKPVKVIIKSVNGLMKYKAINTPTLPKNAFDKNLQELIDLDKKFDSLVFDKYLNSFSNAFEDLTEEQIQDITEKPHLDEEAFNF